MSSEKKTGALEPEICPGAEVLVNAGVVADIKAVSVRQGSAGELTVSSVDAREQALESLRPHLPRPFSHILAPPTVEQLRGMVGKVRLQFDDYKPYVAAVLEMLQVDPEVTANRIQEVMDKAWGGKGNSGLYLTKAQQVLNEARRQDSIEWEQAVKFDARKRLYDRLDFVASAGERLLRGALDGFDEAAGDLAPEDGGRGGGRYYLDAREFAAVGGMIIKATSQQAELLGLKKGAGGPNIAINNSTTTVNNSSTTAVIDPKEIAEEFGISAVDLAAIGEAVADALTNTAMEAAGLQHAPALIDDGSEKNAEDA